MASNNGNGAEGPKRVGLAIQGGVIPAGAFAAGVISGLAEKGAFEKYDICAFSGTSSGALVAALCWARRVLDGNGETFRRNLMADLENMWMYLAAPNHLAVPIWHPMYGEFLREVDSLCMKSSFYREWVKNARTPYTRFVQQRWVEDCIPLKKALEKVKGQLAEEKLKTAAPSTKRQDRIGLVLGSADVLRGEITTFREDEISVAAVLASGSFEEFTGLTTIATSPHAGTYIDGAWGDNPPINELLDYRLDEIWFITCWPKAISDLPKTPAERKERQNELWQNSLVEHEMDVVEFVNYWLDALNDKPDGERGAIWRKVEQLQKEGKLPGQTPEDPALKDYLRTLHDQDGELPKEFSRLFDEANDFQLKHYKEVKTKRIERLVPRELGDIIVNVPWYIRNMMRHGCERAHDFADRDFGNVMSGEPTAPLPGIWAYTPKPFDDHAYDVRSHAAECELYEPLDICCDLCPKTIMNGALDLLLPDAFPQKAMLETSRLLCEVCPTTIASRALAPVSRALTA